MACCDAGIMPIGAVGGPVPTQARVGRQHQRYGEAGERLVAGCIPVRTTCKDAGLEGVEVLLVSSRGGKAWSFPKGGWETDETVEAAAKRETVEESGVRGCLEDPMVGEFHFISGKALRLQRAQEGHCIAYVFGMHVEEELTIWPEQAQRQRAWFRVSEAMALLKSDWMRDALREWVSLRGWDARALTANSENVVMNGTASAVQ